MKRLVLVDGNALLHRAYHATPPLTTANGELINAVFGFTSMILRSITDLKPDFIAVAWDKSAPTFRHQAFTQYKATRGPSDDSLTSQYERVHQVVESLSIPEFGVEGYEADDLIGTLARQAVEKEKQLEVIILTGDRDIMQIIEKRVKVLMPKKTLQDVGLYGVEEFRERFGFEPKQIIEYKALAGDASDNIPGVPGIGEVTATKLIKEFGSVEKIYLKKNLETVPERTRRLLEEGAESAVMSKKLATLDLEAPIKLDLEKCKVHDFDKKKVVKLFEVLQFKSLINKIPGIKEGEIVVEKKEQGKQTTDLDLEVTPVLEKMSGSGVLIDVALLDKLGTQFKNRLSELEKEIYKAVGHEFNINSPKQLAEVLFDDLKLPVFRKTKTGRSTDEETLLELKPAHPCVPLVLEYRQLYKLVSTYVDALPKCVKEDGRIHSTFNVEGAATGRLSSTNPNLQNIPNKGEGSEIRKAFIAPKGKVLLAADYSQIELRILAHLSGDEALIKAFKEGQDIHKATASKIFNIAVEDVTKEQRMVGKTMNFATLYGQGPHALSRQLGIDYETAKKYIDEYFIQFPKVKEWMGRNLEFGYKHGYVETISGRRRYIPELQATNKMIRSFGERAAINHPGQGSSADMIKKAMVDIEEVLSAKGKGQSKKDSALSTQRCSLILQVHDELLFECDPECLEEAAKLIKYKMENALKLDVPVVVDLKSGPNWGEMTPLKI